MSIANRESENIMNNVDIVNKFLQKSRRIGSIKNLEHEEVIEFLQSMKQLNHDGEYLWHTPFVQLLYDKFYSGSELLRPDMWSPWDNYAKKHKCSIPNIEGLNINNVLLEVLLQGRDVRNIRAFSVNLSSVDFSLLHKYTKCIHTIEILPEYTYIIEHFPILEKLSIMYQKPFGTISIKSKNSIKWIQILGHETVLTIDGIEYQPSLHTLSLTNPAGSVDFTGIGRFKELRYVGIGGFTKIEDIQPLLKCKKIKKIDIMDIYFNKDIFNGLDEKSKKWLKKRIKY